MKAEMNTEFFLQQGQIVAIIGETNLLMMIDEVNWMNINYWKHNLVFSGQYFLFYAVVIDVIHIGVYNTQSGNISEFNFGA